TYPARKDSRFGVSLAQPVNLEMWEVGIGMLGGGGTGDGGRVGEIAGWLRVLYDAPAPPAETFDSYLHEADGSRLPAPGSRTRRDLSWWALLAMLPEPPPATEPWSPGPVLLADQGLAVLRHGPRYVSLECGPHAGGHGHPDRLHLTLHDGTVHWLADPGTGSYVSRDLFWYRGTLAHNAPRLDQVDQPPRPADCLAFDSREGWSWAVGRFGEVTRTVVCGPAYVLDLVELTGQEDRLLEVPWHFAGGVDVTSPGRWRSGELAGEFVERVEEFEPADAGPSITARATAAHHALDVRLLGGPRLVRGEGPGLPGTGRTTFLVSRVPARNARLLTVLVPDAADAVRDVRWSGDEIEVETATGVDRHRIGAGTWAVTTAAGRVTLAGALDPRPAFTPFLVLEPHDLARGLALGVDAEPALDGTLTGFDTSEPLTLELEDQYRRSEEPFTGPEDFSAVAWVNWTDDALVVAVEVRKADVWFRPADAPALRLDNEADDIHSDGLQVYLGEREGRGFAGYLVVPERDGTLRVRLAGGDGEPAAVRGRWRAMPDGYRVTLRIAWPAWTRPHAGGEVGFDLLVNEMYDTRVRRAGQLVWSGGNGWVYLRGDRQDPERLGVLELIG
ncbi:MAG TPA: heparinase II/III family protein, partial [Gemmatimonadales bacterium]|nr:heparinase II/III family protein [Gemmatimonadales bacterium]